MAQQSSHRKEFPPLPSEPQEFYEYLLNLLHAAEEARKANDFPEVSAIMAHILTNQTVIDKIVNNIDQLQTDILSDFRGMLIGFIRIEWDSLNSVVEPFGLTYFLKNLKDAKSHLRLRIQNKFIASRRDLINRYGHTRLLLNKIPMGTLPPTTPDGLGFDAELEVGQDSVKTETYLHSRSAGEQRAQQLIDQAEKRAEALSAQLPKTQESPSELSDIQYRYIGVLSALSVLCFRLSELNGKLKDRDQAIEYQIQLRQYLNSLNLDPELMAKQTNEDRAKYILSRAETIGMGKFIVQYPAAKRLLHHSEDLRQLLGSKKEGKKAGSKSKFRLY